MLYAEVKLERRGIKMRFRGLDFVRFFMPFVGNFNELAALHDEQIKFRLRASFTFRCVFVVHISITASTHWTFVHFAHDFLRRRPTFRSVIAPLLYTPSKDPI